MDIKTKFKATCIGTVLLVHSKKKNVGTFASTRVRLEKLLQSTCELGNGHILLVRSSAGSGWYFGSLGEVFRDDFKKGARRLLTHQWLHRSSFTT